MKLIIISNRLPVTVQKKNHKLTYTSSEGGLATGLKSVYKHKNNGSINVWVGWPGIYLNKEYEENLVKEELKKEKMVPVFLNKEEIKNYYEGFSNEILWPTFHYFTQHAKYSQQFWDAYKRVNQKFFETVAKIIEPGDIVWVHDYQLLLLPELIREKFPETSIGFFQHIPFPSFEVFRMLPWRKELLKGIIGADLIGFQTYDDVRHFLSSVSRILGIKNSNEQLDISERPVLVDLFPIGIDYNKYAEMAVSEQVILLEKKYRASFGDKKIILSIDRLDYTKGIAQRLLAFEEFLTRYPEYKEKVSLIQIVVPSRDQVEKYKTLREEVNMLVGRINSSFRTITWEPIHYFYRSFDLPELSAFYRMADIALVTPLRDGMNLVCKEFIASKYNQKGGLILSEMAGASKELSDAILINPNDINQIIHAIYKSLTKPEIEQIEDIQHMQQTLKKLDIFQWVKLFMERLEYIKEVQNSLFTKRLDRESINNIYLKYNNSQERLLFLDYDGTLTPFNHDPRLAMPDQELLSLLEELCSDPKNKVVLASGRDKNTLEKWVGFLPIDIIAEHGVWMKQEGNWKILINLNADWKDRIFSIMENYVIRTPGAFIEEKDFSLVWHYRKVENGLADIRARELNSHLKYLVSDLNLQVLEGDKVIEVKSAEVDKGKAAAQFLNMYSSDFILAIGDDWTDEDMFKVMPEEATTIRVRSHLSLAKYSVSSFEEVRNLLQGLMLPEEITES